MFNSLNKLIEFKSTKQSKCPYLKDKLETKIFIDLTDKSFLYNQLSKTGFRRVENWAYKPICENCDECIPIRVDCENFIYKGNYKRCVNKNKSVSRIVLESKAKKKHYKIFTAYQNARHFNSDMSKMNFKNYKDMIENSPVNTFLSEYSLNGRVIGLMLLDTQDDGLSSVYSFYDTNKANMSIGKYMIIDSIILSKEMKLKYLYLGYSIKENLKMSYKLEFEPHQKYLNGNWV